MNPHYPPIYGFNSTTIVLLKKGGFVIKYPEKVDMPLNNKHQFF